MRVLQLGCIASMLLLGMCSASISGPFLFWGHEQVVNLQPRALLEATETDFSSLYKEAKAVVIFVRNATVRLDGARYPKFQAMVKQNAWAYLPQHLLLADPINYNANVEVINLSGNTEEEDDELLSGYNDAVTIYGEGEVLGILANRDDDTHYIAKREAASKDVEESLPGSSTTIATPSANANETDVSFIYLADGKKAILYVNKAPLLYIPSLSLNYAKLLEPTKSITFDDQRMKGYGRLNINFMLDGVKLFLRFNFSVAYDSWAMKAVEVEYNTYKSVLTVDGGAYDIPYAPLNFSYRCASRHMNFSNDDGDMVIIDDYQLQPWLFGADKFGDVYDCIGYTTAPIWAGIIVTLFLCGALSIGLLALLDIKTPNRFESSRSKQLTFTVQE